eukprot:11204376-Lingulodinium_polyedra.AAC.1
MGLPTPQPIKIYNGAAIGNRLRYAPGKTPSNLTRQTRNGNANAYSEGEAQPFGHWLAHVNVAGHG